MIPLELDKPSLKRQMFDVNFNQESLAIGMDLINEYRDRSRIKEEVCKILETKRYNSEVKPKNF